MKSALGVCSSSLQHRDSLRERKRSAAKWESTQTSFPRNVRIFNMVCLAVSEQPDLKSAARKITRQRDSHQRSSHSVLTKPACFCSPCSREKKKKKPNFHMENCLRENVLKYSCNSARSKMYALNRQKGEKEKRTRSSKRSGNWFMTLLQANRNLIVNHMDGFSGVSESRVLEWTEARFPGQVSFLTKLSDTCWTGPGQCLVFRC